MGSPSTWGSVWPAGSPGNENPLAQDRRTADGSLRAGGTPDEIPLLGVYEGAVAKVLEHLLEGLVQRRPVPAGLKRLLRDVAPHEVEADG